MCTIDSCFEGGKVLLELLSAEVLKILSIHILI